MKTLDQIACEYGTDKASVHPTYKGHDYCRHYELPFAWIRDQPIKLLEIGVGGAESIKTWLDYFPNAKVFGVDIVHDTNPWNTPSKKTESVAGPVCENDTAAWDNSNGPPSRYTFVTGDQSCETFWACFIADYGKDWDIIVDDGGHSSQQIITTFKMLWPHVKPGGFHCIEDLGCSYSNLEYFCTPGWPNHMEFIRGILDNINRGENEIDRMYFSRELAILRKA